MKTTETHSTYSLTVDQALQEAITHHKAGNLQDAERFYRAILQARPNHPDANHNLGVLAVQMQKPSVASQHFKVALEADPNQQQYWLSYIDALILAGQLEEARKVLLQGRERGVQGEAVDAMLERLESQASELSSEPTSEEIGQVVTLFNQCRYTEAETLARKITVRFPQHGFCLLYTSPSPRD